MCHAQTNANTIQSAEKRDYHFAKMINCKKERKDAEEEGADRLFVAELDDRLKQASTNLFDKNLHLDFVRCADSEHNLFLQITDLFTASANRVLNESSVVKNHKTDFAEFFLNAVDIDKSFVPNEKLGDMVVHISL